MIPKFEKDGLTDNAKTIRIKIREILESIDPDKKKLLYKDSELEGLEIDE